MTIFDVLTFVGGLSLFLFGMNYMGGALEKKAGGQMSGMLSKFTSNKYTGFILGMLVTAVIQSSSATTVMVVGFVNSGIMTISRSVGVIMGANVGTTITSWVLSLTGLSGDSFFIKLLKPTSFTPILALVGVILFMFQKNPKKRDTGMILLGFSVLMFGMDTLSGSVSGLADVPGFTRLFTLFENPVLGVLAGAVLTAVIQSSSASVGILQALCVTGQITVGAAFPIILGQNIGTCVTAMLSSVGANKNAKRAAMIHFNFNVFGSALMLVLYYMVKLIWNPAVIDTPASAFTIAVIHTLCNVIITAVFLPASSLLEKISCKMVKEDKKEAEEILLDERLFVNPGAALGQSRERTQEMATDAVVAMSQAMGLLSKFDENKVAVIKETEEKIDKYEDIINSYLVKLSAKELSEKDSFELTKLIHVTGGFERISDHAVHLAIYARELSENGLTFSDEARREISVVSGAVLDVISLTIKAFKENNIEIASYVEPLEQVIDKLTAKAKNNHIERMLKNECTFEIGLIYSDILSVLERVSDHCSEIAASMIEISHSNLGVHEYLHEFKRKDNPEFIDRYRKLKEKYTF